jgi:hypothetical protein
MEAQSLPLKVTGLLRQVVADLYLELSLAGWASWQIRPGRPRLRRSGCETLQCAAGRGDCSWQKTGKHQTLYGASEAYDGQHNSEAVNTEYKDILHVLPRSWKAWSTWYMRQSDTFSQVN